VLAVTEPADRAKEEILIRLRRVEGQIRGIQRMVEEERECEAIATQLMAARAALDKASLCVMSHHIARCLSAPEGPPEKAQLERVIAFFMRFAGEPAEPLCEPLSAPSVQAPASDRATFPADEEA